MSIARARAILQVGLVGGALTVASASSAQTTPYTTRAGFTSALSATQTNNLNTLANGSTAVAFGALGTGTLSGATVNNFQINNPSTGNLFSFTITFSQLMNGFGADFTSAAGAAGAQGVIQAYNGSVFLGGIAFSAFQSGANPSFLGITTVDSFDRVVISDRLFTTAYPFQSLDNLTVGRQTPASTVPEPATLALVATGLAVAGGLAVRRKQTTG